MPKKKKLDPNSQGYTNALLEEMNDKFEIISEAVQPIPEMQEQIAEILTWEKDVKMIPAMRKQMGSMQGQINDMQSQGNNMQGQINDMQSQGNNMQGQINDMQSQLEKVLSWEDDIKLIPAIFEEVGSLRKDVEVIKEAMKLLGLHDKRLMAIEKRLRVVEQRVG